MKLDPESELYPSELEVLEKVRTSICRPTTLVDAVYHYRCCRRRCSLLPQRAQPPHHAPSRSASVAAAAPAIGWWLSATTVIHGVIAKLVAVVQAKNGELPEEDTK